MLDAINTLFTAIALVVVLADFYMRYAEEERRERHLSRLRAWVQRAGTLAALIRRKLILTAGAAGAGLIVWSSLQRIAVFGASDAPISRPEIIQLLLSSFNLVAYGLAAMVLVVLLLPKTKKENAQGGVRAVLVARKEGESFFLSVKEGEEGAHSLIPKNEISIQVECIEHGRVQLTITGPAGLSVSQA